MTCSECSAVYPENHAARCSHEEADTWPVTYLTTTYWSPSCEVELGDVTPWGPVVAIRHAASPMGRTRITTRDADGVESTDNYLRLSRVPLIAMTNPMHRDAPAWACRPA